MKNILFLISVCLFASCDTVQDNTVKKVEASKDSISIYYAMSGDENLTLNKRLQSVNKSLFLSKNIKKDTLFNRILYQKNLLLLSLNEYDSLQIFNQHLISDALKISDNAILGRQYYLMGYYFNQIAHIPDNAFRNYNLSKYYFNQINDSSWVGKNLLNMSTIQKDQNDFFGSKETITEAIQYLSLEKDKAEITSSYNTLATDHRKLINYDEAIKYYFKAIETSDSKKDRLVLQNNIAATYIDKRQFENAITLLEKIRTDTLLISNKKEYARVLDNLAYARWLYQKNIKAEAFLTPLKLRKLQNDKRGQIASYTHLGEFYSKSNIKRAKTYFDSVIQLSKRLKIPRAEKDAFKFLMELTPKSVSVRDRYIFLQDSLYKQETNVKTQFAKYKYDDKVTQEANLRLEKENTEQKLEVAEQRNQKTLAYAIGVPLFLILGFITYFFVQRSKRLKEQNKTARLEATYETEAELSNKLHDDFGGKLNHAMLLLQSEANNEEVLNIVDELYNQSRDFSREINDVDTGPNFKDFLFGMMGNYSKNTKLIVSGSTDVDWLKISSLSKKTLFKVLQELMINMQKHSDANLVSLAFEQTKKMLKVSYADDGAGASSEELNLKNGLWNTEKRINAIDGTIIFKSEKGDGFEAQIEIPN